MIHIYTQQHINDDSIFCLYLYFFPLFVLLFFVFISRIYYLIVLRIKTDAWWIM
jgi:hypothetical protein